MDEVSRQAGHGAGDLAKLATEGWIPRLVKGIEAAIRYSFQTDMLIRPVITQDETKRRFDFCMKGIRMMRRDLGYAVPRIIDELPRYLRACLDGGEGTWTPAPEERQSWVKEGDERVLTFDGEDIAPPVPEIDTTGAIDVG